MKYEVTYTVQGLLNVFKDVVECKKIDDCESEVKKLVEKAVGKKSVKIVLIRTL